MSRSKGKLERVRSASELRVGMLVVLKACRDCGANHRIMLLRTHPAAGVHDDGTPDCGLNGWKTTPVCDDAFGFCPCGSIAEGRLYRVEDGLETDEETTVARRPERVSS